MADPTDLTDHIRAGGGRITAARQAVIDALFAAGGHVTADDLIARIQAALPRVDRSTVYRNLAALEDAGLVYHVHLAHGPSVYHLATGDEFHAHAVCDGCGGVVELPPEALRNLASDLKTGNGFELGRQHFALSGRCRGCAPRRSAAARARGR